jgi:uncharacterized protein (TIRG00374 family)
MKRLLGSTLFRIIISISLIIVLLYAMRGNYEKIASTLRNIDVRLFALALALFLSAITVASYRLSMIVKAQREGGITLKEAVSLTLLGYFFNNFLPTSIGGDVVKAYYLSKKTGDNIGSFTSVFVDRLTGLLTMIFMASVALLFIQSSMIDAKVRQMLYIITLLALLAVLFMINKNFAKKFSGLLVFVRPLEDKLINAYRAVHRYKDNGPLVMKTLLISVVSQLLFYSSFGAMAASIGSHIRAMDILLRLPVVGVMSLLPSLNGLGLREGATVVFFGPLIGKGNAFAVSILWIIILLITSFLGGLIYVLSPQFRVRFEALKDEGDLI